MMGNEKRDAMRRELKKRRDLILARLRDTTDKIMDDIKDEDKAASDDVNEGLDAIVEIMTTPKKKRKRAFFRLFIKFLGKLIR
jgi:uncharacterized protein YPO0396